MQDSGSISSNFISTWQKSVLKLSPFLIFLILDSCSHVPPKEQKHSITIQHEFIAHPKDPSRKVEFYWAKPAEGNGPWPVKIFIHGHQEPERPGGKVYQDWGKLAQTAEHEEVAVAVSQPGYGESSGPPDFCGPFTQQAVQAVIDHFRSLPFVLPEKIGLEGVSRGALVASMLVTQDPRIASAVLLSGSYDTAETYRRLKRRKKDHVAQGIVENIEEESGASKQAFLDRSPFPNVKKIKTPLLILNGAMDDRTSPVQAKKLGAMVAKNGGFAQVIIYPNLGHHIPIEERSEVVHAFFRKYLKDK